MKKYLATIAFLCISFNLLADTLDARILRLQGAVYVVDNQGIESRVDRGDYLVNRLDTVLTKEGGRAVVKFNDGTVSVLDEKSSLRIENTGWISQLGGKIYYLFSKLAGNKRSKTVATSFATIGIRGTEFIVNVMENNKAIVLKKGNLQVVAPEGEYEIHRTKAATADFDSFRAAERAGIDGYLKEFEDYRSGLDVEYIEYKKELSMGAGQAIRFTSNRVDSVQFTDRLSNEFIDMREFAGRIISDETKYDFGDDDGFR